MITLLIVCAQVVVVLALAPFVTGLVRWFKARFQGRKGAVPWLVYVTLLTMLKKEHVISPSRSWMFRLVPFVVLGTVVFLTVSLPLLFSNSGIQQVDFFVLAGVLALSSVFLVFGGMDAATAFGGMGASREMALAALIEPAVLTTFAAFATAAGSSSIQEMFSGGMSLAVHPALLLSFVALILVALSENARYPVDNPATHLELTMVHEAMVLEYSGPYLAMLEFASSVKLTVFLLLLGNLLWVRPEISMDSTILGSAGAQVLTTIVVGAFLIALLESSIAKMRFFRMQEYMSIAFVLALSGLILIISV